MSPEIAGVIARQGWRAFRPVLYIAAGTAILFILLGVMLAKDQGSLQVGVAFGVVGLITFAIVAGLAWLIMLLPVRRDLRTSYYLRTSGRIRVETIPFTYGAVLHVAGVAFQMKGSAGMRELRRINNGTVDHSPYGHVILAAWDPQAHEIYRAPGYGITR